MVLNSVGGVSGAKRRVLLNGATCFLCKSPTTQARSGSQPSRCRPLPPPAPPPAPPRLFVIGVGAASLVAFY